MTGGNFGKVFFLVFLSLSLYVISARHTHTHTLTRTHTNTLPVMVYCERKSGRAFSFIKFGYNDFGYRFGSGKATTKKKKMKEISVKVKSANFYTICFR